MKLFYRLNFLGIILLVFSCGKKTNVKGTVFSKHNVPVAKVEVLLEVYKGKDYPDRTLGGTTTDQNGVYNLPFRFPNNTRYKIICFCDSGKFRSDYLTKGGTQTIDMHLK